MPKLAFAAAACAAVIAVAAIAGFGALSGGPQSARVVQASVVGSPGRAALRVSGSHAELVVRDLRPPSSGTVYEVWLTRPAARRYPRTRFDVTATGAANVTYLAICAASARCWSPRSPREGARAPTHPALIVARLT